MVKIFPEAICDPMMEVRNFHYALNTQPFIVLVTVITDGTDAKDRDTALSILISLG